MSSASRQLASSIQPRRYKKAVTFEKYKQYIATDKSRKTDRNTIQLKKTTDGGNTACSYKIKKPKSK